MAVHYTEFFKSYEPSQYFSSDGNRIWDFRKATKPGRGDGGQRACLLLLVRIPPKSTVFVCKISVWNEQK